MNRNSTLIVSFLVSALASFTLATAASATELARINGTTLSVEEFNKKYQENLKFFLNKAPSKKSVLDDLIKRELGVQEAKKLGLDKDADVIDKMNAVLFNALLEKKLSKDIEAIHVSDDEAKSFYAKNPEIRTSHIFVGVRPDAPADLVKKAKEKIQKIEKDYLDAKGEQKMSFSEIAQRFSEGPSAPMGGDIDYQTRDKLDPAYYETAIHLKSPGKVSEIVRTRFGFHIIKLTALRPWEEVDKAQVKRLVFEEKRQQIFEHYMAQLRQGAKISIKTELLKE